MEAVERETALFNQIVMDIERHSKEYDLTYSQIIGVLEIIKNDYLEDNGGR